MAKQPTTFIHLGFEIGSGKPVEVPLGHTFVTGQTQLSGKTSTLRAIVGRANRRAIAFVTKRGEEFDGRRVAPYLPREGKQPIHWRLVEVLLASALGQRAMKYERFQIINAAKGAYSLADVRRNVERLRLKSKGAAGEIYMMLGEYLDLVLPEMEDLDAADTLDLEPGLNVMDLGHVGPQLQALVIRAVLERINQHEKGVLTVFPEAWEFAPRSRSAPAKEEAIAMARKGSVLHNFLLCDSQDIAGVDTVVRQAASVWLLGVQRELNEVKRTLAYVGAGIAKPKAKDVVTLGVGQFYACWGSHAIKTYVQPAWMPSEIARQIAMGELSIEDAPRPRESLTAANLEHFTNPNLGIPWEGVDPVPPTSVTAISEMGRKLLGKPQSIQTTLTPTKEPNVTEQEAAALREENRLLKEQVRALMKNQEAVAILKSTPPDIDEDDRPRGGVILKQTPPAPDDFDSIYQAVKARLIEELPSDARILRICVSRPELRVEVKKQVIDAAESSMIGRVARVLTTDFFKSPRTHADTRRELERTGATVNNASLGSALADLVVKGFLTREGDKSFVGVEGMKVNIVNVE